MFNPIKAYGKAMTVISTSVVEHYLEKEHIKAMNSNDEAKMSECKNQLAEVRKQRKIALEN